MVDKEFVDSAERLLDLTDGKCPWCKREYSDPDCLHIITSENIVWGYMYGMSGQKADDDNDEAVAKERERVGDWRRD